MSAAIEEMLKVIKDCGFDQVVVRSVDRGFLGGRYFEVEVQRTREVVVGWDADDADADREVVEGVGAYRGTTLGQALDEAMFAARNLRPA